MSTPQIIRILEIKLFNKLFIYHHYILLINNCNIIIIAINNICNFRSLAIFTISIMLFISLCCWCGLVLVAWWSPPKCDPRAIGLITADDQLLPAFVMEIANHLPGIPGLFISGIFGAALRYTLTMNLSLSVNCNFCLLKYISFSFSTLSVGFNSTAVVVLEDFVKGWCGMKPTDRCSTIFVKCVIVLLGSIALGLLFLVEKLGGVLAVNIFFSYFFFLHTMYLEIKIHCSFISL